jgi:hypothetical protein
MIVGLAPGKMISAADRIIYNFTAKLHSTTYVLKKGGYQPK